MTRRVAGLRALVGLGWIVAGSCAGPAAPPPVVPPAEIAPPPTAAKSVDPRRRVIVVVWDGLRPDSVEPGVTPELARLRDERGVNFVDHHSLYPTFTMMNAAGFATGARSGAHGFYGNFEYQPGPVGKNAKGADVDYAQPFFSEDHAILITLDAFYRERAGALLRVPSLWDVAHAAGLRTATVGKAGPAFLMDYRPAHEGSVILDENVALPRSFAEALQAAGLPLPKNAQNHPYPEGALTLAADNGDPTAPTDPSVLTLADGVTPDPRADGGSAHNQRTAYMMRVFIEYILPKLDPTLSMVWLRNPDSTQHNYGPGSPNVIDALRHQDKLLGDLLKALTSLGLAPYTDLLVVSDHGHSTIAADPKLFPLRALDGAPDGHAVSGAVSSPGYVVSGDVRSAEWLRRAGFPHVYDGVACVYDPVLVGLNARGEPLHATHEDAECGKQPKYATPSYRVPTGKLANDAIVIAANGGSEYFYVPSQDKALLRRLVTALQERRPYGPLFVRGVYGSVPGTLPLARIGMESPQSVSPPTPDVVVSFDWDDAAVNAAGPQAPGSEHSSPQSYRGMHGSFSPVDVHNTLIAVGPDFRSAYRAEYPSSTLDVATTVAALLGLTLPASEGRVLEESLVKREVRYEVKRFVETIGPVPLRRVCDSDDPNCKRPRSGLSYRFDLHGQTLSSADGAHSWTYLDKAKVAREPAATRAP